MKTPNQLDYARHDRHQMRIGYRWWIAQNGPSTISWAITAFAVTLLLAAFVPSHWPENLLWMYVGLLVAFRVRSVVRRRMEVRFPGLTPPASMEDVGIRLVLWALIVIVVVNTTYTRTCPHGTEWGAAGIGVAKSPCGGPCRNGRVTRAWHVAGQWYIWAQ